MFEGWMLAAMEEEGYMTTRTSLINRVAKYLVSEGNAVITYDSFCKACYACDVQPDSFTQDELDQLEKRMNLIG